MADKIKLPPMMSHPECHTYVWTEQEKAAIRARDLEVARVVLEAAAKVCDKAATAANIAWCISGRSEDFDLSCALANIEAEIRALEIKHD